MAYPQKTPYVEIIEQPISKKFRYEAENRSAGSIIGVNSSPQCRTYPTIKIHNYIGEVRIIMSCVTKEEPYKPHPHKLVSREECGWGACVIHTRITEESNEYPFRNLGIQCVKKCDMVKALNERQKLKIDPFKTGFKHMAHPQYIDQNAVRLCFQVFIPDASGHCRHPLTPVVSDIIYNYKANCELQIVSASHCSGSVRGDTEVFLLCEKLTREQPVVVFYLEESGRVVWQAEANTILVHKQYAIVFKTPPFKDPHVREKVTVKFELKRVTDNVRSNSWSFVYYPEELENTNVPENQIKLEPNDRSTPHVVKTETTECQWSLREYNQTEDAIKPEPSTYPLIRNALSRLTDAHQSSIAPITQPSLPTMHSVHQTMHPAFPTMHPALPTMQAGLMQPVLAPNMSNGTMTTNIYPLSPYGRTFSNIHALAEDMKINMQQIAPTMQHMPPYFPYLPLTSPRTPREMEVLSPQNVEQLSPYSPQLRQPQEELKPILQKMEADGLSSGCLTTMAQNCNAELMEISGDITKVIDNNEGSDIRS